MTAAANMTRKFPVTPVPKPRQTRSDRWRKRPSVLKYRAFADEVRLRMAGVQLEGAAICFHIPMPKTWPKYMREEMDGELHRQTPDLDNLLKALFDALHGNDCHIASLSGLEKRWAVTGSIDITQEGCRHE